MFDKDISTFLVEVNKLRYIPCVDRIQKEFEEGIVKIYRKKLSDTFSV